MWKIFLTIGAPELCFHFRSPPRHPVGPPHYHDRHQPMPVSHHASPHMRHDHRDRRDAGGERGRHEREYRDRRTNDHMRSVFRGIAC